MTEKKSFQFSESDVRAFFRFLRHPKGAYTEIRAINPQTKSIEQHFVKNERDFVERCKELNGKYNVYAGVNPRKQMRGDASSISLVTVIPIDIDSRHPKDEAATQREVEEACAEAIKLKDWIEKKSKKKVGFTFSGNGFHLLIPVREVVRKKWNEKVAVFYNLLQQNFENKRCRIDNIGDLPRVIKVSGTKSIKGSNSEKRPHRYSYAIELGREEGHAIIDFIEKLEEKEVKGVEFESVSLKGLRHCFKKAVREKLILGDHFRLALACEYIANGRSNQEIQEALAHYPDYDPDITEYHVGRIRKKGYKPFKCDTIARKYPELGKVCQDCKKERKPRWIEVSYFSDASKIYLEVLTTNNQYKIASLEEGKIELADSVEISKDFILVPRRLPEREGRSLGIVKMPNESLAEVPLLEAKILYAKIEEHFKKYIDLSQLDLSLCVYYTLFTWLYPKTNTLGYLRFIADTGKGKTRMLRVVSDLCFYPVSIMGAGSFSGAMRTNEKWRGTMIIDESDFKGEKEDQFLKYLNLGFQKGKYFPLSDKQDPKNQEWFDPFSPKIIAMREPFNDNAIEGRLLSISPRETTNPDIPILLGEKYEEESAEIRNLIARFVLEHWSYVDGEKMIDFKDMQLEPRLRQLSMPLTIIFQIWEEGIPSFRDYIAKRQKEIKKIRALSWHGMLFNYVYAVACVDEELAEEFSNYYKGEELQAVIPKMVAKTFNTTAKNATLSLRGIGFEIEHKNIYYVKRGDMIETKRKTVRAYVVPDEQTWKEIVQRYYYSEDGRQRVSIPEILMSSRYNLNE